MAGGELTCGDFEEDLRFDPRVFDEKPKQTKCCGDVAVVVRLLAGTLNKQKPLHTSNIPHLGQLKKIVQASKLVILSH